MYLNFCSYSSNPHPICTTHRYHEPKSGYHFAGMHSSKVTDRAPLL